MPAKVRVGGVYLDSRFTVSDLRDSTIYRREGWSGDYQASCTWSAPPGFSADWLCRGALFEVVEHGLVTWRGVLSEPDVGDVWSLHANGLGSLADEHLSVVAGPTLSTVPNDVVDYAIGTDGLAWQRWESLGSASVGSADGEATVSVSKLLDRAAQAQGKRWHVDTAGEVTFRTDPTTPTFTMTPGSGYMGTADDQYVTHLYGYYVSSVNGTTGLPDGWGLVVGSDSVAAAKFGRKALTVDLTALGLMTAVAAQANIEGRFALVGGRMGWTNGVDLSVFNLRRLGSGPASPLNVRAGDMLRIPGVMDARSTATVRASIDVVLGEVTRVHAERRAFATPVGFTPRDFQGAVAPAQRVVEVEAA